MALKIEHVERTRAGLDMARQLDRKPKITISQIEAVWKLLASGIPPNDVANDLGVFALLLGRPHLVRAARRPNPDEFFDAMSIFPKSVV